MTYQVLIADDHEIARLGLRAMFDQTEFLVVAEASSGSEAKELAARTPLDIAILDVRMPQGDGLEALQAIHQAQPELPVVMLTAYENPTHIARAMSLGACGYLSKSKSRDELLSSLRVAVLGQPLWTAAELRRSRAASQGGSENKAHAQQAVADLETPLTAREFDVLQQLALGLTNKEIAQALGISYETVKEHVQHLLRKIGVSDRTKAAVWAVRQGIV